MNCDTKISHSDKKTDELRTRLVQAIREINMLRFNIDTRIKYWRNQQKKCFGCQHARAECPKGHPLIIEELERLLK